LAYLRGLFAATLVFEDLYSIFAFRITGGLIFINAFENDFNLLKKTTWNLKSRILTIIFSLMKIQFGAAGG